MNDHYLSRFFRAVSSRILFDGKTFLYGVLFFWAGLFLPVWSPVIFFPLFHVVFFVLVLADGVVVVDGKIERGNEFFFFIILNVFMFYISAFGAGVALAAKIFVQDLPFFLVLFIIGESVIFLVSQTLMLIMPTRRWLIARLTQSVIGSSSSNFEEIIHRRPR